MNFISIPTSLGDLTDPTKYTFSLELKGEDPELLVQQLRMMLVIRIAEEIIGDNLTAGKIACPCHLGVGQEAIAVGVSSKLRMSDRIFGGHRSHSHYLAQGGSLYALFAEVLGKEDGCSRGMGGSMHLYDGPRGFFGSVPIVGATIPLAVGAALAAQKDKKGDLGIAYFGDGSAEEGIFHESLNFAATFKLPVIFVCENNLFSSHLHISLRQPSNCISRLAAAQGITYEILDGNDVIEVSKAFGRLAQQARIGEGPGFLEAVTYRWRGHVGPREDIDVGVKRSSELVLWKNRDPIQRLSDALKREGILSGHAFEHLREEVRAQVQDAWEKAERAPYPPMVATLDRVYAE